MVGWLSDRRGRGISHTVSWSRPPWKVWARALLPAVQDRFVAIVVVVAAHDEHVLDPQQLLADRHAGPGQGGGEKRQNVAARR
jgi:hypothetical protein